MDSQHMFFREGDKRTRCGENQAWWGPASCHDMQTHRRGKELSTARHLDKPEEELNSRAFHSALKSFSPSYPMLSVSDQEAILESLDMALTHFIPTISSSVPRLLTTALCMVLWAGKRQQVSPSINRTSRSGHSSSSF
ncbi:unnamed protein product [Rangifer tarandus platyrhynchus]|uniref:Uncharacterized protein n=1 Tax=Rangifer tarandus platyrhynchus TaxID=3082113 RepID=A0AC59Y7I4_RANTA